jgi:tellurite methyltransferase
MGASSTIGFFDVQFGRQVKAGDFALNPFESAALPHLRGAVLEYGCGLGNLALAAAERGCEVTAMDASAAAIEHLNAEAAKRGLALHVVQADLRDYRLAADFDAVVCIGLLMFFDCPTAFAQLDMLQAHVVPGGLAIVNVLVEGTTYLDMFDASGHCLFAPGELDRRFAGWQVLSSEHADFPARDGLLKSFATITARKPS